MCLGVIFLCLGDIFLCPGVIFLCLGFSLRLLRRYILLSHFCYLICNSLSFFCF